MILVDTSAWAALFIKKDTHHTSAIKAFDLLLSSREPLSTTDYILDETFTVLVNRNQNLRILRMFDDTVHEAASKNRLKIQWMDHTMFQEARRIFFNYAEHRFSFTDCASLVIARQLKINRIFSFDEDFIVMGFDVIPHR